MTRYSIRITDAVSAQLVEAELIVGLSIAKVIETEGVWGSLRRQTSESEHSHWDWTRKTPLMRQPGIQCLGVVCDNEMQGMLLFDERGHQARLMPHEGRPLVYVHFLEIAPWNIRRLVPDPRFHGVGQSLIQGAVVQSREMGYDGRVSLHSLPQSEGFYEHGCRMTPVGEDMEHSGLMYFEFTAEQSGDFELRRSS